MKARIGGPMSVEEMYQALYQDRDFFRAHAITHVKGVFLYFTPCNEYGEAVTVFDKLGNPIDGFVSAGAYHCAADSYESGTLQPKPVVRKPSPARVPFAPF